MGALKAINEYIKPSEMTSISCSSIGVLNGYSYAANKLDEADKMWHSICKSGKKIFVNTVLRSSFLQQSITDMGSEKDIIYSDFYISLLNFRQRTLSYNNLKTVDPELYQDYLRASVAMPIYNRAVNINGHSYYDGAMVDNIPVYPLLEKDLDYIIVVYFDNVSYIFENMAFDKKVRGYDVACRLLDPIFDKDMQTKDEVYDYIKQVNKRYGNKEVRVTGDMLVTNINRVVNKLAKRKIK